MRLVLVLVVGILVTLMGACGEEDEAGLDGDVAATADATTTTVAPTTTSDTPPPTDPPTTTPPPPPPTTEASAEDCHPSYQPCVPIASDVDCAGGSGNGPEYTGRVEVIGPDEYDLDRDGDGVGCE